MFGKLDIDLKTYEFSCYTANMCYDPRQFWPTPTKDSYFPLRKLDLKRFAEATKTIWNKKLDKTSIHVNGPSPSYMPSFGEKD